MHPVGWGHAVCCGTAPRQAAVSVRDLPQLQPLEKTPSKEHTHRAQAGKKTGNGWREDNV